MGFSGTFITACSGPAEAAATVASGSVASAAVAAVAAMETAEPEPARGAAWNQTTRGIRASLINYYKQTDENYRTPARAPMSLMAFVASHRVHSPLPCVRGRTNTAR